MKKILILGGTNFIGRNLVELLLKDKGNDITLFNRGITNSTLFSSVKTIKGDRNSKKDLENLPLDWEYIIDFSCYYPENIELLSNLKYQRLKKYIFISTCSVYDNKNSNGNLIDETFITLNYSAKDNTNSNATYGRRKAECERILINSGLNYSILRPSLVYGQYDTTDRFYYWLYNVQQQHDLIIPESDDITFSITYVKDIINVVYLLLNVASEPSIYNVITKLSTSIIEIVNKTQRLLNRSSKVYEFEPSLLTGSGLKEWIDIPLWLPNNNFNFSNKKLLDEQNIELYNYEKSIMETIQYYDEYKWYLPKYGIDEITKNNIIIKNT